MNKIKPTESTSHYIYLFGGFGIFFLVTFLGWELAENFGWFADIWASTLKRWLIIIVGTSVCVWFLAYIYSYFWGKKKFLRTFKEVKIKSLTNCKDDELVRVQGTLVAFGELLVAPYSGKQCAVFETRAFRQEDVLTANGRGPQVSTKSIWETIKVVKQASDFLIKCDGSYALIKVTNGNITIHIDTVYDQAKYEINQGGFLTDSENNKRQQTLECMGLSYRKFVGAYAADIKFEEGVLEPGEQIAVIGKGTWVEIGRSSEFESLRDLGVTKVFEIKNHEDVKLHISDSIDVVDKI